MGPRSPHRMWLLLATPLLLITLLIMSWFHWLPGGWYLRNLVEAPAHRAERLRLEHRADRLEEFEGQRGGESPGQVVFLGSSTIEFFPLDTCFPGKLLFQPSQACWAFSNRRVLRSADFRHTPLIDASPGIFPNRRGCPF